MFTMQGRERENCVGPQEAWCGAMGDGEQDYERWNVATAGVNRMMLWTDLEGSEVNGGWRLVRLVRPEGRMAWFEGTGPDGAPVMLSLTEALNDEDELLERLRAATEIRHPNVVAVREAQFVWVEDTPVVMAAMEPTEENLGDVLRERTLNADETRMVIDALLAGLAAIHKKKLVHGRMEAASVLAMGETIKLRSDCLQIPGTAFAAKAAEDVRGVARVVVQALTRRIPAGENDPVLQLLPETMARAVRRALSGNATVEEVAALAGTRLAAVPEYTAVRENRAVPEPRPASKAEAEKRPDANAREAEQRGAAEISDAGKSVAEKPAARVLAMKPAEVPVETKTRAEAVSDPVSAQAPLLLEDNEPDWNRRRSVPYVIGAAVVLVLATIFVLYGMLHRGSASKQPAAQTPQQAGEANGSATPARVEPATAAEKPSPSLSRAGTVGTVSAPAASEGLGWRVIAYTYNHEAQAQQKATDLANRYPQLQPSVFAPKGAAPYLVILGGDMSRADANGMRAKAVRLGLPQDTYVQHFR